MTRSSTRLFFLSSAALLSMSASSLAAQACLGSTMQRGRQQVGAAFSTFDAGTIVTLSGASNFNNAFTITGGIDLYSLDFDGSGFGIGTAGVYELSSMTAASGCPYVGVNYSKVSYGRNVFADFDFNTLAIPVGFAIGKDLGLVGGLSFVPSATGALVIRKTTTNYGGTTNPALGASSTALDFTFGASLGSDSWYGRVSLGLSTANNSNTVLSIGGAVILGNPR